MDRHTTLRIGTLEAKLLGICDRKTIRGTVASRWSGDQGWPRSLLLAIAPDGSRVYGANIHDHMGSVIQTATDTGEPKTVKAGASPSSIAISPECLRSTP